MDVAWTRQINPSFSQTGSSLPMGCGASSTKGRETYNNIPREAEPFFPPAPTTEKTAEPTSIAVPKTETPPPTGTKPTTTTPSTSPKKKKSTYVPPSPITAPVPASPEPVKSVTVTKKVDPLPPSKKDPPSPRRNYHKQQQDLPPATVLPSPPVVTPKEETMDADEHSLDHEEILQSSDVGATNNNNNNNNNSCDFMASRALDFAPSDSLQGDDDDDFLFEDPTMDANNNNNNNIGEVIKDDLPEKSKIIVTTTTMTAMNGSSRRQMDTTPEPSSESGMRFDELYRLKGVLGTGAFSTVREGFHRSNADCSYAVKCINRKKLTEEDEAALLDEVAILKEMKHVHIIRLYDFFVEPSTYYLVMERMRGGELFDRIVAKAYYNEKEARDTCKILLEAVGYCHDNHVAHRDLKPENLLLLAEDDDSAVKIADFGFAKKVYEENSLTTQCGTPGYVAPEILEGTPYDWRSDMWSVGVILYILLGGYPPFIESTQRDLFRKIRKGDYEFHEEYWGTVSTEAKDLISSLLTVDARKRLTAAEALENGWILGDDAKLAKRDLGANLEKFRNFNGKRKLRAAVSAIIAMNKMNQLSKSFFKESSGDAS